ncbi:MAG: phosphate ABC transporter substrate-binding protein PstS [Mycobacteriaceae bacterium]|nr:phosphate ABC transporter substrate-binding protein PstS [Mycobacteriaceae bacterium]
MKFHTVGKTFAAILSGLVVVSVVCLTSVACGSDKNTASGTGTAPVSAGSTNCAGKDHLTAEGSTAQQNAVAIFNQTWGLLCPGKSLSYNSTGSAAGRQQFIAGNVDFAGSDSPLPTEQIDEAAQRCKGNPAWDLPLVFGPIALVYNLSQISTLVVNGALLAKIFSGAITHWNDLAIAALNPGLTLPSTAITPIYRSDSSGTTDNFQKYLTAAAPHLWTNGVGSEFQGGVGEGAQKSAGVVQAVKTIPGAIGYVEKGFADQAGMAFAEIDTGHGAVSLTADTARKAIDSAAFLGQGNDLVLDLNAMYATNEPGAYPLVLATYEIVCSKSYDSSTAAAVKSFLTVAAHNRQEELTQAGYLALPDRFKRRLIAAINAVQ